MLRQRGCPVLLVRHRQVMHRTGCLRGDNSHLWQCLQIPETYSGDNPWHSWCCRLQSLSLKRDNTLGTEGIPPSHPLPPASSLQLELTAASEELEFGPFDSRFPGLCSAVPRSSVTDSGASAASWLEHERYSFRLPGAGAATSHVWSISLISSVSFPALFQLLLFFFFFW